MARAIDWAVSFSLVCEDSETWKLLGFQLTSVAEKLIIPKDQINHKNNLKTTDMFLILYSQILGKNHKTINIPATTHHESDQQTFICYLSKLSSLLVRHLQKPLQCPVRLTRHFRHHF